MTMNKKQKWRRNRQSDYQDSYRICLQHTGLLCKNVASIKIRRGRGGEKESPWNEWLGWNYLYGFDTERAFVTELNNLGGNRHGPIRKPWARPTTSAFCIGSSSSCSQLFCLPDLCACFKSQYPWFMIKVYLIAKIIFAFYSLIQGEIYACTYIHERISNKHMTYMCTCIHMHACIYIYVCMCVCV